MSSFGNLFAMKNQAQGGTGLAGIPAWKLLAASALSNIGKPGTGLNPLQLIMAQKQEQAAQQEQQQQQQNLMQLAQMGKYDQNAGTAINPLLGRPSPQMAQSPQSKLGAMAATNPLVAQALATQNLQNMIAGPSGFSGVANPGDVIFDKGKIVASVPAEAKGPEFASGDYGAWQRETDAGRTNLPFFQWAAQKEAATRAPEPSKDIFSPESIIKNERELRSEVKPINDAITAARDSIRTLNNYFEQGGPLALNYVIKQFERANEPGAIVRESDVEFIQSAQSRLNQLQSMIGQMKTGEPISEALKTELRQLSEKLLEAKEATFQSKVNEYAPIVQQYKGTIENVFTPLRTASPRMKPNQSTSSFDWQGQMLGDGWSEINGVPIRRVK